MPTAWRILKTRHTATAFDGEGARLYGGRWNSSGIPVIYTAESRSLAILEVLVHLHNASVLPSYSLLHATFDESLVEHLDRAGLPENWREYPAPPPLRRIGDEWAASRSSAVLEVPSAIVEGESNYLINPSHPDFPSLAIGEPEPFVFDPRLFG